MRSSGLIALLVLPAALQAQRTVDGNRLISPTLPAATLEVASSMRYAGAQRFELYGVANAEQHFFVELEGSRITRLLWIQFEGYHPTNTNTHNYRDSTVSHAGRTWHRRLAAIRVPETEARPESDGARTRSFLRAKAGRSGPM